MYALRRPPVSYSNHLCAQTTTCELQQPPMRQDNHGCWLSVLHRTYAPSHAWKSSPKAGFDSRRSTQEEALIRLTLRICSRNCELRGEGERRYEHVVH
jgi:hypothetical protein